MKKTIYYIMPFIIVPFSMVLMELLDNTEMLKMSPYIMGAVLLLISAVLGFFSPTHRTFDYLMTVIMPLSLFCFMFTIGFLDKGDLGSGFDFYRALEVAFQPIALLIYFMMALVVFFASYKAVRIIKKHK